MERDRPAVTEKLRSALQLEPIPTMLLELMEPDPQVNLPEQRFVGEALKALTETVVPSSFAIGAPLLPASFMWRKKKLCIREILEQWKETSPCRHGSGELYVRKHWFRVRLDNGEEMKIYFERQPRFQGQGKSRWWLFSKTFSPEW